MRACRIQKQADHKPGAHVIDALRDSLARLCHYKLSYLSSGNTLHSDPDAAGWPRGRDAKYVESLGLSGEFVWVTRLRDNALIIVSQRRIMRSEHGLNQQPPRTRQETYDVGNDSHLAG